MKYTRTSEIARAGGHRKKWILIGALNISHSSLDKSLSYSGEARRERTLYLCVVASGVIIESLDLDIHNSRIETVFDNLIHTVSHIEVLHNIMLA
jgi:hypothetical protein